jgi:hypothetical protein
VSQQISEIFDTGWFCEGGPQMEWKKANRDPSFIFCSFRLIELGFACTDWLAAAIHELLEKHRNCIRTTQRRN